MNKEGRINVEELHPHPQNNYYFDDMDGDAWDALIQSISTSGVTNAITITDKNVIISGHQRVRACKVLGINEVSYKMIHYDNEDNAIKDLIESNLRQRVLGNPNPVKMGRCFDFLQKYYGIQNGAKSFQGNRYTKSLVLPHLAEALTQEQLADTYGISVDTINRYIKLSKAIPEIGEFVENGVISKSTALSVIKLLSSDEQDELVSQLDATKRYTQKQVEKYVDEIRNLKNAPQQNEDYAAAKQQLQNCKDDYSLLQRQYNKKASEVQDLRKQIEVMNDTTPTAQYNKKLKDSTIFFCAKIAEFIEKVGGYVWLTEHLNELPDHERKSYIRAVTSVYDWADTLLHNIND